MTLKDTQAVVRVGHNNASTFEINKGVRQGDALSALLFITALDRILYQTNINGTIKNKSVQIIAYADDVAIAARDVKRLEETFQIIEEEARKRDQQQRLDTEKL